MSEEARRMLEELREILRMGEERVMDLAVRQLWLAYMAED